MMALLKVVSGRSAVGSDSIAPSGNTTINAVEQSIPECYACPALGSAESRAGRGVRDMERPVFVLSSGRCGSTLVQRLLNSNERFAIAGEHGGFLRQLSASYFYATRLEALQKNVFARKISRKTFAKNIRSSDQMVAWENFFTEEDFVEAYRQFIRSLFCFDPALRWGFKEIVYGVRDEVAEMLRVLFPEARFVILLRHPLDVVVSKATAFPRPRKLAQAALKGDDEAAERYRSLLNDYAANWGRLYSHLLELAETDPFSFTLRYEDLIARSAETLSGLETFLGEGAFEVDKVLQHQVNVGPGNQEIKRLAIDVLLADWDRIVEEVGAPAAKAGYDMSRDHLEAKKP
jgi:hypothetical protein